MKILLFDTSNLMMRSLYANKPSPAETKFDMFKLTFLASMIKEIKEHNPDRVIMVQDSESWRKEIYPAYKANRAAKREADPINFEAFYAEAEKFLTTLQNCFGNVQFLRVPRAEADDIIATIVKNKPDWQITNISSDKDFYQLFKYENYHQWDGIKRQFIQVVNPAQELQLKIILGDKGDNIPSLKRGVGPVKALKILNEDLDAWLTTESLNDRYNENTQLISFDAIPISLANDIMKVVNEWVPGQFDGRKYFNYVSNSGLAELMDRLTDYSQTIKGLK